MQLLALLHNKICPFGKQAGAGGIFRFSAYAAAGGQFRQWYGVRGDAISTIEVFFARLSNRRTSNQVHITKTQQWGDWHWKTHILECQYTTKIQPHVPWSVLDTSTHYCSALSHMDPSQKKKFRNIWVGAQVNKCSLHTDKKFPVLHSTCKPWYESPSGRLMFPSTFGQRTTQNTDG